VTTVANTVLAHGDLAVRVECEDAAALRWLEEFLVPSLTVSAAASAQVTIALVADPSAYQALLARGPRAGGGLAGVFAFDSGLVELPWWSAPDDEQVAFEAEAQVFYRRATATRVELLTDQLQPSRRVSLVRAVREYFVSDAWAPGVAVVHGAALAAGGGGIAIAGAKNAGKTTLLMQLLRGGAEALIANDRIVVSDDGAGLAARGIPTVVQVRRPPADRLPVLHALLAGAGADHRLRRAESGPRSRPADARPAVVMSVAQFAALLDVPLRAATRLDALLFPRVDPHAEGLTLAPLDATDAARRLRACVWGGARPVVSELFTLPGRPPALDVPALDGWCAGAVRRLRVCECRLGRDADRPEHAGRLLRELVGR
jgi:hypothetical protein